MKKKRLHVVSVCAAIWKSKLFRMMKTTVIVLLVFISQAFAIDSYSQRTRLNIDLSDVTVREILNRIEDQSEFYFMYETNTVDVNRKVSIDVKNRLINDVLDELFEGTDVIYKINNRQIALSTSESVNASVVTHTVSVQQTPLNGAVTDSRGEPLPGVTVVVKGTSVGTITDEAGKYSLPNVSAEATLIFSFIGMKTQEISVEGRSLINVSLDEETIGLEEVVAVGYGVQKKVNMTGSVALIKFDEEIDNRPITNASQAISGRTTGVWVSQNSGRPGSDEAQIRIRGWGTMNNSNPLVIIDGIEGSFDQLNPNDIESISVLKDAASSAIYGSKAANGVILVTTKMGHNREKMQVAINSYVGVQSLGRRYDVITNSAEHMEICNAALENAGSDVLFSDELIAAFRNGTDPYKYPNTDWFNVLFDDALIHEHNVSITGGSQQSSSFLSFNYLNQDGMVPNTSSERYGIRANLDSEIKSWLKVSGRFNYIHKKSTIPYADASYGDLGRVFEMLGGAAPFIAPYTRDGKFGSVEAIDEDGNLLYDNRNPLIDAANGKTLTEENFLTVNASADIKLTKDLLWRTTFASTGRWEMEDKYNESIYGYTDSGVETITKNFNREGLEMSREQISQLNNSLFSTLSYNKSFKQHSISAIAGLQLESLTIKNVYARSTDPAKEGLTQVDAGTGGYSVEGNMAGVRMFSYFGRLNYSFNDKYLLEANIRADASSRFKKGSRWGVFPGFSAGWRLIDEGFIQDLNVFSNLKLRASWGQLGNQNILSSYWPYLTVIEQSNSVSYNYDGSFAAGAAVTSMVDEDITWETTSTLDFGFDAGFLDNRISLEADYFRKETSDIIVQLPIPSLLGDVSAPYENVGKMVNNGFEAVVNFSNQKTARDQFGYNLGLNLTYIKNEVTKFRGGDSPDQLYLIREGYSYKSLYGYKAVGIYQTDEEAAEHMYANGTVPEAGNLKFEDVNNDGKLDYNDKQGLGNTIPKFTFGITPSFSYKGFDLSLLFQGIAKVNAYTQNNFTNLSYENLVISTRWRNAWTPTNTDTDTPSLKFGNSWDNSESSYWIHDISFIKLKNIQLGYALPESITSRLKFEKIYFYVNAQNVFTIVSKDYEGYDPERNSFDNGYSLYPTPRITSVGINLNF